MAKKKKKQKKSAKRVPALAPAPAPKPRKRSARGRTTRAVRGDSVAVNASKSAQLDPAAAGELIALRAFLKWEQRGGDEFGNWVEAEREVHAELHAAARSRGRGKKRPSGKRRRHSSPR